MNKVISIMINSILFNIEETAHAKLKAYLDAIEQYFSAEKGSEEIVKDIEASIADKFTDRLNFNKKTVITDDDVEEIIKVMGKVEDFGANEDDLPKAEEKEDKKDWKAGKKLYRDPDDTVIAGVCSGIAAYFGIDTTIVRIIFVISIFLNGFGILAYIILWIAMPIAKSTSQKLEMQGEKVNIAKLTTFVKEKTDEIKAERLINRIGKVIRSIFKALFVIIGFLLVLSAAFALAGLTAGGVMMIFAASDPSSFPFGIAQIMPFASYVLLMIALYFTAIIPVIFLLIAGATFMNRKNAFSLKASIVMLTVWFVAIMLAGLVLFKHERGVNEFINKKVDEKETSRIFYIEGESDSQFALADFKAIDVDGAYEVNVRPGAVFAITAQGNEMAIDRTDVSVSNSVLMIRNRNRVCFGLCLGSQKVAFHIEMPEISGFRSDGAAVSKIEDFSVEDIKIDLDGASRSEFVGLNASSTAVVLDGVSKLLIAGETGLFTVEIDGASNLDASDLIAAEVKIESDGVSKAFVFATSSLDVTADGASKIEYSGSPDINQDLDGAARLKKAD